MNFAKKYFLFKKLTYSCIYFFVLLVFLQKYKKINSKLLKRKNKVINEIL
jgi:hypothetical protein